MKHRFFRARKRHIPGAMNKTEAAYAQHLELRKRAGHIVDYWFETFKFKLADKCWYTPDFVVQVLDDTMECHEVKGFWEDDARVKVKVVAAKFPFRFVAVTKKAGAWQMEEFNTPAAVAGDKGER